MIMRVKKEINVQIGERIKLAREGAGLTQEQLAERVEVSPQYVSDLERGVVGVSLATLKRICLTLCVSSDALLFGSQTQDRSALLAEVTKSLSDSQFRHLTDLTRTFVQAVEEARRG